MSHRLSIGIAIYDVSRKEFIIRSIKYFSDKIDQFHQLIFVFGDADRENNQDQIIFKNELIEKSKNFHGKMKIVDNKGNGLSHARNTLIDICESDYLAFIDDDAIPEENWLKEANYIISKNYTMIGGKILPFYSYNENKNIPEYLNWIFGCTYTPTFSKNRSHKVRNPIGANMMINLKKIKDIRFNTNLGRSNGKLLSAEETEFAIKLLNMQSSIYYTHNMIVHHAIPNSRLSAKYLMKRAYYEGITKSFLAKNIHSNNEKNIESNYLKFLLNQLLKIQKFDISNNIKIILVLTSFGLGYLNGIVEMRKKKIII